MCVYFARHPSESLLPTITLLPPGFYGTIVLVGVRRECRMHRVKPTFFTDVHHHPADRLKCRVPEFVDYFFPSAGARSGAQ